MSFQVQNQIRQNATDIRKYIDDLYSWEEEINSKDKKPSKSTSNNNNNNQVIPPIRGNINNDNPSITNKAKDEALSTQSNQKNSQLIRDKTSIPEYYKAWDKFDADEEIQKVDGQKDTEISNEKLAKKQEQQPQKNSITVTSGAKPGTKMVVKGGRNTYSDINSMKDKGNMYYKALDFEKALTAYTECLSLAKPGEIADELLLNLYSNRAMTYIKLNDYLKAEKNSSEALLIDPNHVKSLCRRGKSRFKLKKYKEALSDYERAYTLEPDNKEITQEIKALWSIMNTIKQEKKKSMILKHIDLSLPTTQVLVEDYDPDKKEFSSLAKDTINNINPNKPNETTLRNNNNADKSKEIPAVKFEENKNQQQDINDRNAVQPLSKDIITDKPIPTSKNDESSSEFLKLKDVEGRVVTKGKTFNISEDGDEQKYSVHFRIDLNEEFQNKNELKADPTQVLKEKKPSRSILKKSKSMGTKNVEIKEDTNTIKDNALQKSLKIYEKELIAEMNMQPAEVKLIENSSQFLAKWKHIKGNIEACSKFIETLVKPERIPLIFKEGIEADLFLEIVDFLKKLLKINQDLCSQILLALPKLKRFEILVKFLTKKEKQGIIELIEGIDNKDKDFSELRKYLN